MMSRVDNWIPEVKESLILLSRSLNGAPRLLDGKGKVVATLPFPPAVKFEGKKRYYAHHFVQHFDMDNDGREEMLIYNEEQLWVYANRAPIVAAQIEQPKPSQSLPSPRIYNSTFYTGMQ